MSRDLWHWSEDPACLASPTSARRVGWLNEIKHVGFAVARREGEGGAPHHSRRL